MSLRIWPKQPGQQLGLHPSRRDPEGLREQQPAFLPASLLTLFFLRSLDVTFRRDAETHRPRINKPDSLADKEQKASGNYFYVID